MESAIFPLPQNSGSLSLNALPFVQQSARPALLFSWELSPAKN